MEGRGPGPGGLAGGAVVKDVLLFVVKVLLYLAVLLADFVGDTLASGVA